MFAIITQLQLPQSCRHSNGAGRPSLAAKWQEGARALWAGRGGVARAPGAVPPAPFVGSPPPGHPLPRGQRERGFVWAPGGWRGPGEAPADACSCCRPVGQGGAGVRRAGGARGPCGSGLNLGLVLPPGCPQHTPGSLGLATHSVISGAFSGRVFMTHSPIYPARGPGGARSGALLGVDYGRGPGPGAVFGDSQNSAFTIPIPLGASLM